jgi:antitoxin component YwqK of YwqJK toxin-antitoxin module
MEHDIRFTYYFADSEQSTGSFFKKDPYDNVYIIEFISMNYPYNFRIKKILNIYDINDNIIYNSDNIDNIDNIDNPDEKYNKLIDKIQNIFISRNSIFFDYSHAKQNAIHEIYFGDLEIINQKYNYNNVYDDYNFVHRSKKKYENILNNFTYSGMQYYYNNDGIILRKFFHNNGKIEGKYYGYDLANPNNIIFDIDFVNGKIHGNYIHYYANGLIKMICKFENNKICGEFRSYHSDGKEAVKCNYIDGLICGEYIYNRYYTIVTNYINGKEDGIRYRYYNNKLSATYEYKKGKKNGLMKVYDKNNVVIDIIQYVNNKRNGHRIRYKLKKNKSKYYISEKKYYCNNKRQGIQKYYNENNEIIMKKIYDKDVIRSIFWYENLKKIKAEHYDYEYVNCDEEYKYYHVIKYNKNGNGNIIFDEKYKYKIERDQYDICNDSEYDEKYNNNIFIDKFYTIDIYVKNLFLHWL